MPSLQHQIIYLFLIAIPVSCIAWTVTNEEVFREPREYCIKQSKTGRSLLHRKFFYLFTCEYCFSHYITILMLVITRFHLLFPDWRGYLLSGFSLVWIANFYMSLFRRLRLDIKKQKTDVELKEELLDEKKLNPDDTNNQDGNEAGDHFEPGNFRNKEGLKQRKSYL